MESVAKTRFIRISAFKARHVADLVRGKRVEDALAMLQFMPQKASFILDKTIRSAIANAEIKDEAIEIEDLWIKKITVDEGPTMSRIEFRAQGRVNRLRKRMSHITVVLADEKKTKK